MLDKKDKMTDMGGPGCEIFISCRRDDRRPFVFPQFVVWWPLIISFPSPPYGGFWTTFIYLATTPVSTTLFAGRLGTLIIQVLWYKMDYKPLVT